MANAFDIAEGKVNPFDVAEGKVSPFDIAESQAMPSQAVVDAQKLTGTPVAPGMPTSVAQLPDTTAGIKDVAIGIPETPVKLASDIGQFALEATTPFKYLENMLFGQDSGTAFQQAQEHTRAQQELINYQPVSKMGAQAPAIPFAIPTAVIKGGEKLLDIAGGEGTDVEGNVPLRKQAAEGIKQGILSSLAMLGIKKAMDVAPVRTSNVAKAIEQKVESNEKITANKYGYADTPYTRIFGLSDRGGSVLGDAVHTDSSAKAYRNLMYELGGDKTKASRFMELWQNKDAITAEKEFPQFSGRGIETINAKREKAQSTIEFKNIVKETPFDIAEKAQGEIPAGSLAYGQKLPEKRMGIRLERLGGENYDTQKAFLDLVDMKQKEIMASKKPINFAQMTKEAEALGYTIDDFVGKGKKASVKDYAYQKAFADATTASIEALSNAKKKIGESQGSPEALAEFAIALDQASLIVPKYIKAGTEQARGLVARRINGSAEALKKRNFNAIVEAAGGADKLKAISDAFSKVDLSNQYQVNKFIREVTKVKTADKVYWVWLNSILSGPPSHVANILSNSLTAMTKTPEKGISASLDVIRSLATGKQREVYFGEVPHDFFGAWQGVKEGAKAAMKAWVDDMPQMEASKLEVKPAPLKGKVGRFIGGPTRALMAADEFFKSIIYRSEINSLAYRQASHEGLKGKAKSNRIAELSNTPLDWMQKRAIEEAKYRTFQKELGPIGTKAMNLRNESMPLKVLFPFIKTPTNIVKFGLERTPLEFIDAGIKVAKGDLKGGAISEQMAKPILGSIISGAMLTSIMDGNVSGAGPVNKNERDSLYRTGWQPYSIKIKDKWYSYKRLEPVGMVVGLTADTKEIWKYASAEEKSSLAAAISTAVGQNILNKTWMQGASNAMNAITDPNRYGESWVQSLAGSAVPGVVATAARALDPNMRQAQDIIDGIKTRLPVISEEVLPKLNLWGEPIKKSEGVAERFVGKVPSRFVSPVQVSPENRSKIDKEIVRLIGVGYLQPPGPPGKVVGGIDLTPEQYQEMQSRGGGLAKKSLERIVETDVYKKAPDMAKTKIIESVIENYRRIASSEMLGKIKNEQGKDIVAQGEARSKGIIPKNIKPSPEKNLSDILRGIRGNQ